MQSKLPYLSSLQGLRGVSILAVVIYHLNSSWLPGGFLGVEVFFVVSGYIVTSLIIQQLRAHRELDIWDFLKRRARRLVPAAYILIAVVIALAAIASKVELVQLRSDVLASLLYVQNWHMILSEQSYFTFLGQPSLLQHLWSLAIEAQFYIVWAGICAWLLSGTRRRVRPTTIMKLAIIVAILSQVLSAYLSTNEGPDRAYYGTDTRLTGLLIGAALAFYVRPAHLISTQLSLRKHQVIVSSVGVVCLSLVIAGFLFVSPYGYAMYYGGFLLLSLAVAGIIIASSLKGSLVHIVVSSRPLTWLGDRSYSLYLWHWPVFVLTKSMGLPFAVTVIVQLVVSVLLSEMSFRWIETPMRARVLPMGNRLAVYVTSHLRFAALVAAAAFGILFYARPAVVAGKWLPDEYVLARQQIEGQFGAEKSVSISQTNEQPLSSSAPSETPDLKELEIQKPLRRPDGIVTVIGDSVTLGAGQSIIQKIGAPVILNAEVNRSPVQLPEILRQLEGQGQLGATVVIAIGWNGLLTDTQFVEINSLIGSSRRVYWVLPAGDRPWIRETSSFLRATVPSVSNHNLVPWDDFSASHPEWFAYDQIHVVDAGAEQFAGLIYQAILTR